MATPASAQLPVVVTGPGLVNVNVVAVDLVDIEDVTVQVPIAVAANVCGVPIAVLADLQTGDVACEADATALPVAFRP